MAKKTVQNNITINQDSSDKIIDDSLVRMTIDLPKNLHQEIKLKAIVQNQTMRTYVIDLILKDLVKKQENLSNK
jgi:hypothetical protein